MTPEAWVSPDDIRASFSRAMSEMYKAEVPQYGTLCELVAQSNRRVLERDAGAAGRPGQDGPSRLAVERHGAIRLGTPEELVMMRRLFGVMGMRAVGYYDLSAAGLPVHATSFRPIDDEALERNPFRVFTSLLRLDLIRDGDLRRCAEQALARRDIFTPGCRESVSLAERQGGLNGPQARQFVAQALETFRWHREAAVDVQTYERLRAVHPLVADIVCFKGPHINHLTPRVLDIDDVQARMASAGLHAKKEIEGPPPRAVPILLRQTSFAALAEPVRFAGASGQSHHTARFGEVEQRGAALTRKGRARYDARLADARSRSKSGVPLAEAMAQAFTDFPDDVASLHREGLAFFRYRLDRERLDAGAPPRGLAPDQLLAGGWLTLEPLVYEDFLPVSAAGIFRSNLGGESGVPALEAGGRALFERLLQDGVLDEIELYEKTQQAALDACLRQLENCHPKNPETYQ